MKRGSKSDNPDFKVDLIITADWHLMEKDRNPPCRLDFHWDAQWNKVGQIMKLQEQYECPIINAGDVFEHWKVSPHLLNHCLRPKWFPNRMEGMSCIIGNHDMPQHNVDNMVKSGWQTLKQSKTIERLEIEDGGCDWGGDPKKVTPEIWYGGGSSVVVSHMMVWQGESPWPGCEDPEADDVFDIFPEADLIITGHNHKTFTATRTGKRGKRLLINPGSLTRHKADQIDHKPCVFLWNAESNDFKIHYLKVKKDVISREHIDIKKDKEHRLNAFIEKLQGGWDVSLSFKENMDLAITKYKVPDKIKQIVLEWMGE